MEKMLLIIDDNVEIIDIVTEIIGDLFDKVLTAKTVEMAISKLSENQFAFVILDINLEGRNGAEVIKFLVDTPSNPNKSVPFVIVSGIITPQFVQKHNQRFAGVLMKPFEHDELRSIAENVLLGKPLPLPPALPAEPKLDDIPFLKCNLPFSILQLEKRVSKVMDGIRKNPRLKELFSKMKNVSPNEDYIFQHIGMLINISTGICIELEWNTDKTLEKFVFASYLHDMGLSDRPDLAKINSFEELESKKEVLSEVEYKLVLEHPNIAERSLEGLREVPPDVALIIKQHHELPKGTGYPSKLTFQKISPLSSVFIVSHDLTEYILANPKWIMSNYITIARSKFRGSHFIKILSALDNLSK